jgi:D-3-phosphoglycerate dehydrogenase / 2-oxoglutarate reductase
MHIVIPDDYQNCVTSLECFAKLENSKTNHVTVYNDTTDDLEILVKRFKDADAIVLTRERTKISAELLAQLPKLRLISQTGKIASHIDMEACARHGVTVMDGRGSGAATAEFAMLLILASLRHLVTEVNGLASGKWQTTVGRQLNGKRLGVLGFGRIGEQVCRLGAAFGAVPLVWGRESTMTKARAAGYEVAPSRDAFYAECDIVSLQLRLTSQTQHGVTAADLNLMKPTALLVNTSRAELIEPDALYRALVLGRPGFAAVDVYEQEPLDSRHPLQDLPNCLCTPHLGFVEMDNYEAYYGAAFDNILAFVKGRIDLSIPLAGI